MNQCSYRELLQLALDKTGVAVGMVHGGVETILHYLKKSSCNLFIHGSYSFHTDTSKIKGGVE